MRVLWGKGDRYSGVDKDCARSAILTRLSEKVALEQKILEKGEWSLGIW